MSQSSEDGPKTPLGDPQEIIEDIYIASQTTGPLITKYTEARPEFIELATDYLMSSETGLEFDDAEAEMFAEDFLNEVFDSLLDHIEGESLGLWMTLSMGKDGGEMDFPVYQRSPIGSFNSLDPTMHQIDRETPSDMFFEAISRVVEDNEEEGGVGWGGVPNDVWDPLSDREKELVSRIRSAIIGGTPTMELSILLHYAKDISDY